eukprot:CAMPEP_0168624032 /NCGR_PEP_ID=MMETSP0449_2-20121227/9173_1 /TAXON_ID=1082188 /ORGANISM="Strombidium rassoulzadegani, Strain ras09" /LENGTH=77 /DNA_ID=CAMNT_0008665515 /DNA_START=123 /DNA_END=356 /DNA_ORIENTATION=-
MAISATVVGSLTGVFAMVYANAIRKVPLMRQPWGHVGLGLAGAAAANAIVDFEKQVAVDLSEMLEQRQQSNRKYKPQ